MTGFPVRGFYDDLAPEYHLIFADWGASMARQSVVLDGLLGRELGAGPHQVLDCSCGIGTQAIGLALAGHEVVGSDVSFRAVSRAAAEGTVRHARLPVAVADMRRLPFASSAFDVVVCADNSLPHLLSAHDVTTALPDVHRVLREDGLLLLTVRDYDQTRRDPPTSTPPRTTHTPAGTVITFQLWHWHPDGERYDVEQFRLLPAGDTWTVRSSRTTYWALTRRQVPRRSR